ncbi:MAG: phage tail protein [Dehalococcoidia bacterium]|nr:phage tail protein [Dehalococcoidia bacterium]
MPQPGTLVDALGSFRFAVEINGITQAMFDECTGLEGKTEVFEYKEGGLNNHSHKLPGPVTFSNITLKWGMTEDSAMWDWYNRVITKKDKSAELRPVSIVQYNSTHVEVQRWNLTGAFPVKWTGPSFNAAQSNNAVNSMELAFGELTFVKRA